MKQISLCLFLLAVCFSAKADWQYSEKEDEMRGVTNTWAMLASDNTAELGSHRSTQGKLALSLRNMPKTHGFDVIFSVQRGQLSCPYDGCKIPIKFDDGPIITYTADRGEGSHNTLFIREKAGFLRRVKAAKSFMVEVPVWRQGGQQFKFSVEGLQWD